MKEFWGRYKFVLSIFLIWRIGLFLIAYGATYIIPKWGGWFPYSERVLTITGLPSWVWGFGNFDGVHYLKIAQNGYSAMFSQAFFPLFPLLIRFLNIFPKNPVLDRIIFVDPGFFLTGIILVNLFFLLGLLFFYQWLKEKYNRKIAEKSLVLFLLFPTSFYFGAVYTESLFFLLSVIFLTLLSKKKYFWAAISLGLVSAVKVLGMVWLIILVGDLLRTKKLKQLLVCLPISISGLLAYMFFLWKRVGDPLYFLTAQPMFGAERSSKPFILLPQVLYRYLKIFLNVPVFSHSFFVASIELAATLGILILLWYSFKKIRLDYWLFLLLIILLPTLTGTLLSMPRFVLSTFLLLPILTKFDSRILRFVFLILSFVLISLFTRGYWVA